LIEEANADAAYLRVLPDAMKLDGSMLNPITLDVMSVVIATMDVAKKIAPQANQKEREELERASANATALDYDVSARAHDQKRHPDGKGTDFLRSSSKLNPGETTTLNNEQRKPR
jgi:hypothetical protein